jgi:hypothetical protein
MTMQEIREAACRANYSVVEIITVLKYDPDKTDRQNESKYLATGLTIFGDRVLKFFVLIFYNRVRCNRIQEIQKSALVLNIFNETVALKELAALFAESKP